MERRITASLLVRRLGAILGRVRYGADRPPRNPWGLVGAVLVVALAGRGVAAQGRSDAPEQHLPPHITQLTGFGERAVWSPDGKRIAFMGKSFGDAFEIDLATRLTRLLTGHFHHAGFLRVHYLPNGDYLLIGARDFKDIRTTRTHDEELWVMRGGVSS